MGHVYAEIELINGFDLALAKTHHIGEYEIKRMHVQWRILLSAIAVFIFLSMFILLLYSYFKTRQIKNLKRSTTKHT